MHCLKNPKSLVYTNRFAFGQKFTPAKLPTLSYDFGELQPVLSANLLNFHYGKHHAAYVANLNATYE